MTSIMVINSIVFFILSLLHVYWAAGGRAGQLAVVPTVADGAKLFTPGKFATWLVAGGLAVFAMIMLANLPTFRGPYGNILPIATGMIGAVFMVRAIGDFRYVGFFKRKKGTMFARYDYRLYSPLSLYLGSTSLLIAWTGL